MRLGLSSASAPRASLEELITACVTRGFSALELRAGDWHGVDIALEPDGAAAAAADHAREVGVAICAYVADAGGNDLRLARLSLALGAPLLVPNGAHALERCIALVEVGATALPLLDGDESAAELAAIDAAGFGIALDLHAELDDLVERMTRLQERFGTRLRHVRLRGGSTASVADEVGNIGGPVTRLPLAAYDGVLVFAPSVELEHVVRQSWLEQRDGSDRGGAADRPEEVSPGGVAAAGHDR